MSNLVSILAVGAGLLLPSTYAFSASATTNVVMYWGQNSAGSQQTLASYCADSTIDIIPISFLTAFGTGDYTLNFANMCSGPTISGSSLLQCDQIAADIKTCQAAGKKILLSMGGASGDYGFQSSSQAVSVANDLWNYFGGGSSTIRPFGTSIVDGFDLDIENGIPGYYPEFITQMRNLYASQSAKTYYISGAPQCVYPDASLHDALFDSYFDFLFIQFYNNWCGLYQYGTGSDAFNYNVWDKWATTVSKNPAVKLYLGVAANTGAANAGTGYVAPSVMITAAQALQEQFPASFGGIMMWDASQAYANIPSGYSINYAQIAKEALLGNLGQSQTSTPIAVPAPTTAAAITSSESSVPATTSESTSTLVPGNVEVPSGSTSLTSESAVPTPGNVATASSQEVQSPTTTSPITSTATANTPVPAASCSKTYEVVSGDYCYAIWTSHGLSSDTFYALNPTLSAASNCQIYPGDVLCVSGATGNEATSTSTTTVLMTSTSTSTLHSPSMAASTQAQTTITTSPTTTTVASLPSSTAAAGSTCPVAGGICSEGSYQCNGYGYAQCLWGSWVLRDCPTGTACAGTGNNVYCDWPGSAAVTCNGIAGKTSSKRSLVEESLAPEPEVETSMSSARLNSTHFVITLKARATGIMPITDAWYFSFESDKDILEADQGILYRDAVDGIYTISADPMSSYKPTRSLVVKLVGSYEHSVNVQRKSWLF